MANTLAQRINRAGGVFVTGTDTGIGKTVTSACLLRALDGDYWKPVQSGIAGGTDTEVVARLSGYAAGRFHESAYELRAPLSPHEAARRDGVKIEMSAFRRPKIKRPLVVEGAGGVLVPLNKRSLMIDLIAKLKLPVIVVAQSRLGTINHTLLTLQALRNGKCTVLGVIMNGPRNAANAAAIEEYGGVPVIAHLAPIKPLNKKNVETAARKLARAFGTVVS
ncbi:MAG: dethiobiotin synthase [Rhodospirillales bacterium]